MNPWVRIVGTVSGTMPFALAVGLDRTWGWGVGTAVWGFFALLMFWGGKPKKDDDEGREFGA